MVDGTTFYFGSIIIIALILILFQVLVDDDAPSYHRTLVEPTTNPNEKSGITPQEKG